MVPKPQFEQTLIWQFETSVTASGSFQFLTLMIPPFTFLSSSPTPHLQVQPHPFFLLPACQVICFSHLGVPLFTPPITLLRVLQLFPLILIMGTGTSISICTFTLACIFVRVRVLLTGVGLLLLQSKLLRSLH